MGTATIHGRKEVRVPQVMTSMVSHGGSLGRSSQVHTLLMNGISSSYLIFCHSQGAGGMRVGPQYQAVVPDYDPGLWLLTVGRLIVNTGWMA